MTAKELIAAIEDAIGAEEFTDALNGDSDALDVPMFVDLIMFGMGQRSLIDARPTEDDDAAIVLVVGERTMPL